MCPSIVFHNIRDLYKVGNDRMHFEQIKDDQCKNG